MGKLQKSLMKWEQCVTNEQWVHIIYLLKKKINQIKKFTKIDIKDSNKKRNQETTQFPKLQARKISTSY